MSTLLTARLPLSLALALTLPLGMLAGCENSPPGAGFTNPNPGSMTGRDKAAVRTDLPVPDANAGSDAALTEAVSSGPGGPVETGNTPSTATTEPQQGAPEAAAPPTGSPPQKTNAGTAQGDTRPANRINTGTPRSPQ
jgi:hypothetical protein